LKSLLRSAKGTRTSIHQPTQGNVPVRDANMSGTGKGKKDKTMRAVSVYHDRCNN
jgi:hypothetical protein